MVWLLIVPAVFGLVIYGRLRMRQAEEVFTRLIAQLDHPDELAARRRTKPGGASTLRDLG